MPSRLAGLVWAVFVFGSAGSGFAQGHAPASGHPEAKPYGVMFAMPPAAVAEGTVEVEFGPEVTSHRSFFLPTAIKFAPDWGVRGLRRTEFALMFDSIRSLPGHGHRETGFGEALTLQVRKPILSRGRYALAVGPWASFGLGHEGNALGLRTMASWAKGQNHVYANLNAGQGFHAHSRAEVQLDWYRSFREHGALSRLHWSVGGMYQALSGQKGTVSLAQGLSYLVRPSLEVSMAWHEQDLNHHLEHQFWLGLTTNLGRIQNRGMPAK